MGYVEEVLADGETIIRKARFHWLYMFVGTLALIVFGIVLVGIYVFVVRLVDVLTVEIVVTDRRVIYKRGLIARDVDEVRLERIESVSVYQGIFGRIFGYGCIVVRGTGVGSIELPDMIDRPIKFRRSIDRAKQLSGLAATRRIDDEDA